MYRHLQPIILSLLLLLIITAIQAETKTAAVFADHMVLQRNTEAVIWGTDNAGQSIRISGSWGEESQGTTDSKGKWKIRIKTPEAGGPYTLTIQGSSKVELQDILIGEVWLCSGQSNMEMPMKGYGNQPVIGSNDAKLNAGNDQIRLFHVPHKVSVTPVEEVEGEWLVGGPATVGEFSATAYYFARRLQEALHIPIGLLHSSWGGSSAEAWTDAATLRQLLPELEIPKEIPEQVVFQAPSLLYNGMLHPLIGYSMQGAIWYQGESNIGRYQQYPQLITDMVTAWRKQWDQGNFPFYFVQIAPYNYQPNSPTAWQREAQQSTVDLLENSGMAVTLDVGDCSNIHPADKKTVGDRLAYIALVKTYGMEGLSYSGPVYRSMEVIEDNKIKLSFDMAPNGLSGFGRELTGFTVAGEDQVFRPAKARINRDKTLTVWSDDIAHPVAVRYAWDNCPEATLFNNAGLPASSFRTDKW